MNKLFIKISFIFIILNINLHSQGYLCAIGGGSEDYNSWSDAPYGWIVEKADSGKIIILSYSDATNWIPDYFMSLGAAEAYNKKINSRDIADLQSTYDELITADAIFIKGGDQWNYVNQWKDTKTEDAIYEVFNSGGVVAGTSAGAAVLGDVDFSARYGSAYPDEALQNPFYNRMQFENNFLNLIPNVIFDTHFIERARHGRLIAMLYNQHFSEGRDLIGAGIDDRTAICFSPIGIGEVMGSGAVTIFYKDELTNYSTLSSGKYTIENLRSEILTKGWMYDLINKEIYFIPLSARDVDTRKPWQYPHTSFYLTGSNNISEQLNTNFVSFLSEVNSNNIVVVSHPGFSSALATVTDYLAVNSYNYSVLNLTSSNLNDPVEANKVNNATCFVFAGDSLNVLSYLNQTSSLVASAFYNSIETQHSVFFFGNTGKIAGHNFVGNTDTDLYASYRGKMTINTGLNIFGDLIFQPLIFDNSDYYENRMSAVLWGMMRSRKRVGIYLDGNDRLKITSLGNTINGVSSIPYIIVDARGTTKVDSSTFRASGSVGPRQVVAMNNVRFSLTNYSDIKYLLEQGRFDNLTEVSEDGSFITPAEFILYQNYPNPLNPSTTISWNLYNSGKVELKLFDILGNEVETLFNDYQEAGVHTLLYKVNTNLPSGIYFYQLITSEYSETKSMVFLK
ncbi:Type 1 glutamine amidotransferase-like domain-containing protein [Bacteroidota bacterium]